MVKFIGPDEYSRSGNDNAGYIHGVTATFMASRNDQGYGHELSGTGKDGKGCS